MKLSSLIIFIVIVLTVYTLTNYIIYLRGLQALPAESKFRIYYKLGFLFVFISYVISRMFSKVLPMAVIEFFTLIGSIWLAAMLYYVLFIIFLDLARLFHHWFNFFPDFITQNYDKTKLMLFATVNAVVLYILFAGYINQRMPVTKTFNLTVNKTVVGLKELKIVAASDIHIGNLFNKKRVTKMVDSINALQPDIVLLVGDVLSEDLAYVLHDNTAEPLKNIRSKYGAFAITGNHEYIGGADDACKYLQSLNVETLRDTAKLIDSSFYVVGREDKEKKRFAGTDRKTVDELLAGVDKSLPVILLDHQPYNLHNAVNNQVDLQLSGHTHNGQMWPINYITRAIFELSWGYKQIEKTHFYVSCGYGIWGPPVRLGSKPELVEIKLNIDAK